ncbi:MAG: type II toxin-antitoxin system prevent-host-death family antitoxin [Treponema sp.]|nr:type II toxin-antitoxin system prevent-host-death family antitoxin [Treponema sp.]
MEVAIKEFRAQPGRIISQVNKGLDVTITCRGKPCAKIIPVTGNETLTPENKEEDIFGIWKNRTDIKDIELHVRNMRKGRKF